MKLYIDLSKEYYIWGCLLSQECQEFQKLSGIWKIKPNIRKVSGSIHSLHVCQKGKRESKIHAKVEIRMFYNTKPSEMLLLRKLYYQ